MDTTTPAQQEQQNTPKPPPKKKKSNFKLNSFPGWLFITTLFCYAVWNPSGYSIVDIYHIEEIVWPAKFLIWAICIAIAYFYIHTMFKSLRVIGFAIITTIVGTFFWTLVEYEILTPENVGSAKYWGQFVIALVLTFGFRFAKMRRAATGIVTDTEDTDE